MQSCVFANLEITAPPRRASRRGSRQADASQTARSGSVGRSGVAQNPISARSPGPLPSARQRRVNPSMAFTGHQKLSWSRDRSPALRERPPAPSGLQPGARALPLLTHVLMMAREKGRKGSRPTQRRSRPPGSVQPDRPGHRGLRSGRGVEGGRLEPGTVGSSLGSPAHWLGSLGQVTQPF